MTATVHRRPTAHAPAVLDADQAAALNRLTAALAEHLDAGESVPCLDSPTEADWISDRREDQDRAATACQDCPALAQCASYALATREEAGVYGGTTPAQRRDELDVDALLPLSA